VSQTFCFAAGVQEGMPVVLAGHCAAICVTAVPLRVQTTVRKRRRTSSADRICRLTHCAKTGSLTECTAVQVPCRVFDHGEGSYTVSYFPTDVGESAVVRPRSRGPILFMAMLCGCTAAVGTAAVQPLLPTVTVPPVRHMAERSRPSAMQGTSRSL
jgi:hypothetical protein